ncbi:MAG: hypothetical protein AAB393_17920 [Bacteroidota bacterium]
MADHFYLDEDTSYLLGMLVARGELVLAPGNFRLVIHFPKGALLAQGESLTFDTAKETRLGIEKIRERIAELVPGDVGTVDKTDSIDLVVRSPRRTMTWRNLSAIFNGAASFPHFAIPAAFLDAGTPLEYKREFLRGFADVAANVRPANRDQAGAHRVRLDILNHPSNWGVPVQLCLILQEQLGVPVPIITWGHPNLHREWREHQLNVYAHEFLRVGFYFDYKQQALEELASLNVRRNLLGTSGCPGERRVRGEKKPARLGELNNSRLDPALVGHHADSYWQICLKLGCPRRPPPVLHLEFGLEDENAQS